MRWWARAGKRPLAVAAAALLALSGCGTSGPPASSSAAAQPSSASGQPSSASGQPSSASGQGGTESSSGAASTAASPANPPGSDGAAALAWVPPGPVDPADPPQSQWYVLLQRKDCDGLAAGVGSGNATTADGLALWGAATAVCRAVYQGQPSAWSAAAAVLPSLARPGPDRCLDRAAYDLVAGLVAAHAQSPTATPSPAPGTGTACPLALTGLDALDGGGPTGAPSGGLAGGTFQLVGRFLDVVAVLVDGQRITPLTDPDRPGRWDVVMPPVSAAHAVTVRVEGTGGMVPGELTFTYVDGAATAPAGTGTAPAATGTPSDTAPGTATTGGGGG
ncbi:MAG: hypothetical protein ACHP7K_10615 [Actinomycetales bacterium]